MNVAFEFQKRPKSNHYVFIKEVDFGGFVSQMHHRQNRSENK